jgi:hypothetical protein
MSRYRPRESTLKKEHINPIWRGVGCVILVGMTIGGFWAAGYLIDLNLIPLPTNLDIEIWEFTIPGRLVLQLLATALVDIVVYGLMTMAWAIVNPPKLGPLDAPPVRPKGRRSMER